MEDEKVCKVYGKGCPCENAKCRHGESVHDSCWQCGRVISVIQTPNYIVWNVQGNA
jgi:hypothetical protein